jgi:hypothetical protein
LAFQVNSKRLAKVFASLLPGITIRVQSMIDVHGCQWRAEAAIQGVQGVQEGRRIGAAAVRDPVPAGVREFGKGIHQPLRIER